MSGHLFNLFGPGYYLVGFGERSDGLVCPVSESSLARFANQPHHEDSLTNQPHQPSLYPPTHIFPLATQAKEIATLVLGGGKIWAGLESEARDSQWLTFPFPFVHHQPLHIFCHLTFPPLTHPSLFSWGWWVGGKVRAR